MASAPGASDAVQLGHSGMGRGGACHTPSVGSGGWGELKYIFGAPVACAACCVVAAIGTASAVVVGVGAGVGDRLGGKGGARNGALVGLAVLATVACSQCCSCVPTCDVPTCFGPPQEKKKGRKKKKKVKKQPRRLHQKQSVRHPHAVLDPSARQPEPTMTGT